ncbi:MAG: pyridoxamine 5'-phosphate oxidase family protein [Actinomycetota bacterium]|nr:pyridoxamine 5'-phosphate oxidase family protein [Actinomycetota bacterium]
MPRPDLSMSSSEIESFLQQPHIAVLSTIDRAGWPHSVGMYYQPFGIELRMWPYGKSQKVKNLERDPRCAVLVEKGQPYEDLKGVLIRGRAEIVRDLDAVFELGREIYERYWFPRNGIPFEDGPDEGIRAQSRKRVSVLIKPERVASWDHAKA